jgi:hypothetical protein
MRHEHADGQWAVEQTTQGHWCELSWEDSRLTASMFPARRLVERTGAFVCRDCGGQDFDNFLPCMHCGH